MTDHRKVGEHGADRDAEALDRGHGKRSEQRADADVDQYVGLTEARRDVED